MTAPSPHSRNRTPRSWRILFWTGAAAFLILVALWVLWGFRWPPTPVAASAQVPADVRGAELDLRHSVLFDPETRHEGRIIALDQRDRSLVLHTPEGEEERFEITPQAFILGEDRRLTFDALRLGQEVTLRSELDRERRQQAFLVSILDRRGLEPEPGEDLRLEVAETATVVAVEPEKRTFSIRDDDRDRAVYQLAEQALIVRGADQLELSELREGDRVAIMSRAEAGGARPTAEFVRVMDAGDERDEAPRP